MFLLLAISKIVTLVTYWGIMSLIPNKYDNGFTYMFLLMLITLLVFAYNGIFLVLLFHMFISIVFGALSDYLWKDKDITMLVVVMTLACMIPVSAYLIQYEWCI